MFLHQIGITPVLKSQNPSNCVDYDNISPGACPSANLEFILVIDEAFVAQYSGDVEMARSKAMQIFDDMRDGIGMQNVGLAKMLQNEGYDVILSRIHFPNFIALNAWNSSSSSIWAQNIASFWTTQERNCISKDGIILLTGNPVAFDGFYNGPVFCEPGVFGSSRVIVVRNNSNNSLETSKTLAHEICHGMGLDHLDDYITLPGGEIVRATVCYTECQGGSSSFPLMCRAGGDFVFSACDKACIDKFFSQNMCACLQGQFPSFEQDFTCPEPDLVILTTEIHNPNPVLNYREGGNVLT